MTFSSSTASAGVAAGGTTPESARFVARVGGRQGRLTAGSPDPETLEEHLRRLGALPDLADPHRLVDEIERSGLAGRGGGYFPLARKVRLALESPGRPVVVVNATEGEPAVRKDRFLMTYRPHLILDGAQVLAAALGTDQVHVAVHEGRAATEDLRRAVAERDTPTVRFVVVPDRYVAGESSAVVSSINGGAAEPAGRSRPTAVSGVAGRPTVVSNAETLAHLALIARYGPEWFGEIRTPGGPGSALITVDGDVTRPGTVLEVTGPATIGQVVAAAGGPLDLPRAVLIGGYTGAWVPAHDAWGSRFDDHGGLGAAIGCGLVAVMGARRCGLQEAAHLVGWLAGQRAGQCGACDAGLPLLAETLSLVAAGERRSRREPARILDLGQSLVGRGLCGLPDGTVAMVESALEAFGTEVDLHRKRRCSGEPLPPLLPVPGAA